MRTSHFRLTLLSLFVTLAGFTSCRSAPPEPEPGAGAAVHFDRHDLTLGTTARQTVLTGFLLGGETADIAVDHLHGSPWKSLKGKMGDDNGLSLEIYRNASGAYPDEPTTTLGIGLDGAPSHREPGHVPLDIALRGATHRARRSQKIWPRAFNPTWFLGDVNGDGHADFLVERSFRGLDLSLGQPAPTLFSSNTQVLRHTVPPDIEYSWIVDLNHDGKHAILMHHPLVLRDIHGGRTKPPGTENQKITAR